MQSYSRTLTHTRSHTVFEDVRPLQPRPTHIWNNPRYRPLPRRARDRKYNSDTEHEPLIMPGRSSQ